MPIKKPTLEKASQTKISVAVHQLPGTYNELLEAYINLLEADSSNPYEFSFKKRILDFFSIRGQLEYANSPEINNFIRIPDALAQELPLAAEMLKKLDKYDDQSIKAFTKLNTLNLARLRKRSIRNQVAPGLALSASIVGLLLDLQDFLAISIKDAIVGLGKFNISLFFQWLIILIIIFAIVIARINWMFTTPRIGLVDAFGDLLQILMSHRNLKE